MIDESDAIKIDSLEFIFRARFNSNRTVYWCLNDNEVFINKFNETKWDKCLEKGVSIKQLIYIIKKNPCEDLK